MPKIRKFDNVPFWFDNQTQIRYLSKTEIPTYLRNSPRIEYWDSILEFKVYAELSKHFDKQQIIRQHNIELFPKNELFKAWTWNIDFFIDIPSPIYVEAKGKWIINHPKLDSFWHTLKVCEIHKPEVFKNLLLIGKDDEWLIPKTSIVVQPVKKIRQCIEELNRIQ